MNILARIRETIRPKNLLLFTLPLMFCTMVISTEWELEITAFGGDWPHTTADGLIRPAIVQATGWGGGSGATSILWGNFAINLLARFGIALFLSFCIGGFLRKKNSALRIILWATSGLMCFLFVLAFWMFLAEEGPSDFGFRVISSHLQLIPFH